MKTSPLKHEFPETILKHPGLIRIVYALCYLSQFRKWYLYPTIKKMLHSLPENFVYIDAGCGEGQYLFPYAAQFPKARFIGIDKNENNIIFGKIYIRKEPFNNVEALLMGVEEYPLKSFADVIVCVAMIHFVDDDRKALKALYENLNPKGRLLIETPVNGRILLPLYNTVLKYFGNYDAVQGRKSFYRPADIIDKVKDAGFTIRQTIYTYGFFGKLAHELFNIPFHCFINGNIFVKIIAYLVLTTLSPLIFLFYFIDYCTPKNDGNGLIIIAEKPANGR